MSMNVYTKKEVDFIKENYLKYTELELAKILNRPKASIHYKKHH